MPALPNLLTPHNPPHLSSPPPRRGASWSASKLPRTRSPTCRASTAPFWQRPWRWTATEKTWPTPKAARRVTLRPSAAAAAAAQRRGQRQRGGQRTTGGRGCGPSWWTWPRPSSRRSTACPRAWPCSARREWRAPPSSPPSRSWGDSTPTAARCTTRIPPSLPPLPPRRSSRRPPPPSRTPAQSRASPRARFTCACRRSMCWWCTPAARPRPCTASTATSTRIRRLPSR